MYGTQYNMKIIIIIMPWSVLEHIYDADAYFRTPQPEPNWGSHLHAWDVALDLPPEAEIMVQRIRRW